MPRGTGDTLGVHLGAAWVPGRAPHPCERSDNAYALSRSAGATARIEHAPPRRRLLYMSDRNLLSSSEVADMFGISDSSVRARAQDVGVEQVGGRYIWTPEDVEALRDLLDEEEVDDDDLPAGEDEDDLDDEDADEGEDE